MIMAVPFKPQVAAWLHCSVLAEFMEIWRWQNVLPNEFLIWSLKMLLVMGCCQTSMLLLATDITVRMLNSRERKKGARKQPGCTWIEVNNEVHTFVVQDQDHPRMIEIHAKLQRLSGLIYDAGYVPSTESVLDVVEEEEKVFHLCHHSEKLAIAFRLINTAPGTPL
ncbi:unnamed protein product [Sphagnum tenellum]